MRDWRILCIFLAAFWLWHALFTVAAGGKLDPFGTVYGDYFYFENLLSFWVPPLLIAGIYFWKLRKNA